jgi:hypothetical protein
LTGGTRAFGGHAATLYGHGAGYGITDRIRVGGFGVNACNDVGDNSNCFGYHTGANAKGPNNALFGGMTAKGITGSFAEANSLFGESIAHEFWRMTANSGIGSQSIELCYNCNFNSFVGGIALRHVRNGNYNVAAGWDTCGTVRNGAYNLCLGSGTDVPLQDGSYQLNLANLLRSRNTALGIVQFATTAVSVLADACDASRRFEEHRVAGGPGEADRIEVCLKTADGLWLWKSKVLQ